MRKHLPPQHVSSAAFLTPGAGWRRGRGESAAEPNPPCVSPPPPRSTFARDWHLKRGPASQRGKFKGQRPRQWEGGRAT